MGDMMHSKKEGDIVSWEQKGLLDRKKNLVSPGDSLSSFDVLMELGRGTYGVVNKVRSRVDGKIYVLKKIQCGHLPVSRQKEALMEVMVLRRLDHPHVIGYYTSFVEKKTLHILMEYASNGDLQGVLERHKLMKTYIPENEIWRLMYELALALQHLHKKNIIHRDIKMVNVFLDGQNRVKLGDLGVSRVLEKEDEMAQSRVGTPLYLAPELIKRQPYDFKADVWAMGVLMYTLCAQKGPWKGNNIYALGFSIVHDTPALLPSVYSKSLCSIIGSMLEKLAPKRPNIDEILAKIPSPLPGSSSSSKNVSSEDAASMQTTHSADRERPTDAVSDPLRKRPTSAYPRMEHRNSGTNMHTNRPAPAGVTSAEERGEGFHEGGGSPKGDLLQRPPSGKRGEGCSPRAALIRANNYRGAGEGRQHAGFDDEERKEFKPAGVGLGGGAGRVRPVTAPLGLRRCVVVKQGYNRPSAFALADNASEDGEHKPFGFNVESGHPPGRRQSESDLSTGVRRLGEMGRAVAVPQTRLEIKRPNGPRIHMQAQAWSPRVQDYAAPSPPVTPKKGGAGAAECDSVPSSLIARGGLRCTSARVLAKRAEDAEAGILDCSLLEDSLEDSLTFNDLSSIAQAHNDSACASPLDPSLTSYPKSASRSTSDLVPAPQCFSMPGSAHGQPVPPLLVLSESVSVGNGPASSRSSSAQESSRSTHRSVPTAPVQDTTTAKTKQAQVPMLGVGVVDQSSQLSVGHDAASTDRRTIYFPPSSHVHVRTGVQRMRPQSASHVRSAAVTQGITPFHHPTTSSPAVPQGISVPANSIMLTQRARPESASTPRTGDAHGTSAGAMLKDNVAQRQVVPRQRPPQAAGAIAPDNSVGALAAVGSRGAGDGSGGSASASSVGGPDAVGSVGVVESSKVTKPTRPASASRYSGVVHTGSGLQWVGLEGIPRGSFVGSKAQGGGERKRPGISALL